MANEESIEIKWAVTNTETGRVFDAHFGDEWLQIEFCEEKGLIVRFPKSVRIDDSAGVELEVPPNEVEKFCKLAGITGWQAKAGM